MVTYPLALFLSESPCGFLEVDSGPLPRFAWGFVKRDDATTHLDTLKVCWASWRRCISSRNCLEKLGFHESQKRGNFSISSPQTTCRKSNNWCHELHLNVNMFLWKLELVCIVFQCLIRWTLAPLSWYTLIIIDLQIQLLGDTVWFPDFVDIMIEVTLDKTITGCH